MLELTLTMKFCVWHGSALCLPVALYLHRTLSGVNAINHYIELTTPNKSDWRMNVCTMWHLFIHI